MQRAGITGREAQVTAKAKRKGTANRRLRDVVLSSDRRLAVANGGPSGRPGRLWTASQNGATAPHLSRPWQRSGRLRAPGHGWVAQAGARDDALCPRVVLRSVATACGL